MKEHKKLYKSGKLWVTATLFAFIGISFMTTNVNADTSNQTNEQQTLLVNNANIPLSSVSTNQTEMQSSNNIQNLQDRVNNAQQQVDQAQQNVTNAQNKVNEQQIVVNNAQNNLQIAKNNLKSSGGDQSTVQERITVSDEWVNAVKSYLNSNGSFQDVNSGSSFSNELTDYGSSLLSQNQYVPDPALADISITLTSDGVLNPSTELEVTRYTIGLLNPIRESIGVDKYQITQQSLDDSENIAKQYVEDNWTLFTKGDHDHQALANNHHDGESLSDGYITFDNGTVTLDDIHRGIYNSICGMLFADGNSNWGHMTDLAGLRGDLNGIYLGVQVDKFGQVHFNGNSIKNPGQSYADWINGQWNWYTGEADTSTRIPLVSDSSSKAQQMKQAVQDAQDRLNQAIYELTEDNQSLNQANLNLEKSKEELQQAENDLAAAQKSNVQSGWEIKDGQKYFRDNNGNRISGWLFDDSNLYYFDPYTNAAVTGLNNIDGYDYYFDPTTAVAQSGWLYINGNYYYFDKKNYQSASGITNIDDHLYYFNPTSFTEQTGWQTINNNTYYFNPFALNGLQNINGNIYYFNNNVMTTNQTLSLPSQNGIDGGTYTFDSNGVGTKQIQTGWEDKNGNKYYRDSSGMLVDGWQKINSQWYYFINNVLVTNQILNLPSNSEMQAGLYDFNDEGNYIVYSFDHDSLNHYYYFGSDGRAVTGLQNIWGSIYYFDPTNYIEYNGWKEIDGSYYFFKPYAVNNLQNIDGVIYYFKDHKLVTNQTLNLPASNEIKGGIYKFDQNGHGKLLPQSGWKKTGSNWEYLDNEGNPVNDWQFIGSSWYYFENNILVSNQIMQVPSKKGFAAGLYCFDQNGHYLTNQWYKESMNITYYFGSDGRAVTGWQKIDDDWYYFDNNSNELYCDGIAYIPSQNGYYYFDHNGHYIINGWQRDLEGYNFYFGPDGRAVNGWQLIGSSWYYFNNYRLVTNQIFSVPSSANIKGGTYFFDQNGHYLSNIWKNDSEGHDFFFGEDGRAVNGLQTIAGTLYLFTNYQLVKNNWQIVSNNTYFFDNNGHAVNGWQLIGSSWYYFNNYRLVSNQIFSVPSSANIKGGTYFFDQNGHYLSNIWKNDSEGHDFFFGEDGRAVY